MNAEAAVEWHEIALEGAEATGEWDVLSRALNVKGLGLYDRGRPVEGLALLRASLELAVEHGLQLRAGAQLMNLALYITFRDLGQARAFANEAVALARQLGDRRLSDASVAALGVVDFHAGRWTDLRDQRSALEELSGGLAAVRLSVFLPHAAVATWAGDHDLGAEVAANVDLDVEIEDVVGRSTQLTIRALLAQLRGDFEASLAAASTAVTVSDDYTNDAEDFPLSWAAAIDGALALQRFDEAQSLVQVVGRRPPGLIPRLMRGLLLWNRARVAAATDPASSVADAFEAAASTLREHGAVPWLGRVLLDHAQWLAAVGDRRADSLAAEALAILTELGADAYAAAARRLVPSDDPDRVALRS
jgi:hypothetical protein